jgi:hypothetical protein
MMMTLHALGRSTSDEVFVNPRTAMVAAVIASIVAGVGCATGTAPTNHTISSPDLPTSTTAVSTTPTTQSPRSRDAPGDGGRLIEELFLGGEPGWFKEKDYRWVSVGKVYSVFARHSRRWLLVALMPDGHAVCLTGDFQSVAAFLAMQFGGTFPGVGQRDAIARLLKDALVGHADLIAEPGLLARLKANGLASWLKGREKDAARFEEQFTDIAARQDKNAWQIQFNVLTARGALEVVTASGTVSPLTLNHVSLDIVKPPGEFSFPLEG